MHQIHIRILFFLDVYEAISVSYMCIITIENRIAPCFVGWGSWLIKGGLSTNNCFAFQFVDLGIVTSIEVNHKSVESARKGMEVCIKIEPTSGDSPKMYGRHFDETDLLVSKVWNASDCHLQVLIACNKALPFPAHPLVASRSPRNELNLSKHSTFPILSPTTGSGALYYQHWFLNVGTISQSKCAAIRMSSCLFKSASKNYQSTTWH